MFIMGYTADICTVTIIVHSTSRVAQTTYELSTVLFNDILNTFLSMDIMDDVDS